MKPLDTNLLNQILDNHEYIVTIEEGSIGGFSSAILNYVHNLKVTSTKSVIKNIIFPDKFVEHNTPENQYKAIGMDSHSIVKKVLSFDNSDIIPLHNFKKNN